VGVVKAQLELLNKAGSQRMLTQKLVKLLMMKKFNVGEVEKVDEEIKESISDFEVTLEFLFKFKQKNQAIEEQLKKVEQVWERFLHSVSQEELDKMLEINGEVLIEMEKAVSLYEELFRFQRITNAYAG